MATRITNIVPPCGYNSGGITSVRVLDFDDFVAFGFKDAALYDTCLVTGIDRLGPFADVQAKAAKYDGPLNGKIVGHSLQTFIESLDADYTSQLHLASRRRYIVVFDGMNGKPYAFGYEAGAAVSYTGQTDGAAGYVVTFNCPSVYPLFELTPQALAESTPAVNWLPDFINGAYCEIT